MRSKLLIIMAALLGTVGASAQSVPSYTPVECAYALPETLTACYRERLCTQPTALHESAAGRIATFAMTPLGISATQIRTLLASGSSPRYLLPDEVIAYIRKHNLYPEY